MARLRGGTLFSGIGAPECAAPWIDWRWSVEIDPFASAVHKARFPDTPNLGDVTEIDPDAIEPVDLVVFGSPCQDFSVAGQRRGMDGARGNLTLAALDLVGRIRPRWLVFENVPGLLSNWSGEPPSDLADGEDRQAEQYSDFAAFLGAVRECGYLGCWRVLDAQFAGVPQRRRRIFFVGHLGDWRPAAAVLFEPESLRGDTAPRRETGERIARPVASCIEGGSGYRNDADRADGLIAHALRGKHNMSHREDTDTLIAFSSRDHGADAGEIAPTLRAGTHHRSHADAGVMPAIARSLNAHPSRIDGESETFVTTLAFDPRQIHHPANHSNPKPGDPCHPLRGVANAEPAIDRMFTLDSASQHAVAFHENQRAETTLNDTAGSLKVGGDKPGRGYPAALSGMSVRRLTPRECERLQGFADDFTLVQYRGKPARDGNRYRAIGNSMAVPVLGWILHRLQRVDKVLRPDQI